MVFVHWYFKWILRRELSEAREDFAVGEKDWKETKIKTVKWKPEEINFHVSEIKVDHLYIYFDQFQYFKFYLLTFVNFHIIKLSLKFYLAYL